MATFAPVTNARKDSAKRRTADIPTATAPMPVAPPAAPALTAVDQSATAGAPVLTDHGWFVPPIQPTR